MESATPPPEMDPPAMSAAAPTRSTPDLSWVSARVGVAAGLGKSGPGGAYFAELDAWPFRLVGVGIEGLRGASSSVRLFAANDTDSMQALRGRLSFRYPFNRTGSGSATVALGVARKAYRETSECGSSPDICDYESLRMTGPRSASPVLSPAFELGARWQLSVVELGVVTRIDLAGPVWLVTVGPTIGFAI